MVRPVGICFRSTGEPGRVRPFLLRGELRKRSPAGYPPDGQRALEYCRVESLSVIHYLARSQPPLPVKQRHVCTGTLSHRADIGENGLRQGRAIESNQNMRTMGLSFPLWPLRSTILSLTVVNLHCRHASFVIMGSAWPSYFASCCLSKVAWLLREYYLDDTTPHPKPNLSSSRYQYWTVTSSLYCW